MEKAQYLVIALPLLVMAVWGFITAGNATFLFSVSVKSWRGKLYALAMLLALTAALGVGLYFLMKFFGVL